MEVTGLDHVQVAAPIGAEDEARSFAIPGVRRFYTADPWGNRIELIAPG